MKSSEVNKVEVVEQGRAIARGMDEIQTRKEINKAREAKRQVSAIRNAADKQMFQ